MGRLALLFGLLVMGLGNPLRAGRPRVAAVTPPPTPAAVRLDSPGYGAVLQGTVVVHGHPRAPHGVRAALELGYSPQGPWFGLAQWQPPPPPGPLWAWDTTTVADGTYWLRLRVDLDDGTALTYAVPVQVRNTTPAQATPTPLPGMRPATRPTPAHPPSPSPTPWPTPHPPPEARVNPAALAWNTWQHIARLAAGLTLTALAVFTWRAARRRW